MKNAARIIMFAAVVTAGLGWTACAFSQENATEAPSNETAVNATPENAAPAKPPEEQLKRLSGTVSQIEFAQGYMVVNVDELGYIKVYVPESATISRGFESIDISGVGLEDSVIVHYKIDDGKNIAVMIRDSTPSKKSWF